MALTRLSNGLAIVFVMALGLIALPASAEPSRFESYQFQGVPDKANIRLGDFSSDLAFFQSVGVRYVVSSGAGMDYIQGNTQSGSTSLGLASTGQSNSRNQLGQIKKDGFDFPLVSQVTARNYWLISNYMSVQLSFALTYRAFPMGSEDNLFDVGFIDSGFSAVMGSFSFAAGNENWSGNYNGGGNMSASAGGSGFSANLGTDFELTPYIRGRVYDRPSYRTDYVDPRGYQDTLSGQRYPVFQNMMGLDLDWQLAEDKSMGYSVSRTDSIPQDNGYGIGRSVVYQNSLEYRQQINPLTAVGVRGDWVARDYLEQRGSQDQKDCVAFMNSDITDDSSVHAELGYSMAQVEAATAYETNGTSDVVIGGVGLQTRLSETISHGLQYRRSQRAGFQAGVEVVDTVGYHIAWADPETWAVGLSSAYESVTPKLARVQAYSAWVNQITASRPLTRDLTLILASAYSIRKNTMPPSGDLGVGNLFMSNNYDTWVSTIGLIQTLTLHLKLYTYVEHLERISPNPQLAGTREMAGATLGYYYDF